MTPLPRHSISPRPRRFTVLAAVVFAVAAGAIAAPAERGSARQDPGEVGSLRLDVLTCDVYPVAMPDSLLTGIDVGTELQNIAQGTQPLVYPHRENTGLTRYAVVVVDRQAARRARCSRSIGFT